MYLYEPIGTVMVILMASFILSTVLGIISKSKIKYLYHYLRFITKYALNDKGEEVSTYAKLLDASKNVITKVVNEANTLHGESTDPIDGGSNTLAISKALKKLGLTEVNTTFEKIFVIK